MRIAHLWRSAAAQLKAELAAQMQYRADMVAGFVASALGLATSILGYYVILHRGGGTIGGWTFPEIVALAGVVQMTSALMDFWLAPNLSAVSQYVQRGEFDLILIRPIDALFAVTFRKVGAIADMLGFFLGLALVAVAMGIDRHAAPGNILLFLAMYGAGVIIIYALWASLVTLAFYFTKIEEFAGIFYLLLSAGQFPVGALPGRFLQFLFTFLLPVAFVTNVPAEAAMGRVSGAMVAAALTMAALLLLVCRLAWRLALRRYASASS
ncbi:MAG TPA: ABC-2 family transporter protein [Dongiaceae bacterium]|jgi:ABC-2 type transport system permease protein|nr:ABC-2 family transporter protein [Dongiaceae bacterium]